MRCEHCGLPIEQDELLVARYGEQFDGPELVDGSREVVVGPHDQPEEPDRIEAAWHHACHDLWLKEQYAASEWSAEED